MMLGKSISSMFARGGGSKPLDEMEDAEYRPYRRYVEKQKLPVVVHTGVHRIEGLMHVTYHHRALDVLCSADLFLPVTEAKIFDTQTDKLVAERDFIAISKQHVVYLYEVGKPFSGWEDGGENTSEPAEAGEGADPQGSERPAASPETENG
jgi:hypothetical protein